MNYPIEPIIKNTDNIIPAKVTGELWSNRRANYSVYDAPDIPKCSIAVTAYNRLEKTRYCVECILKYTTDVDFELILIDNGSDDGTFEFFESVQYERKIVVKITKNMGVAFAWSAAREYFRGKYLVIVPNDMYVTKNWLSNLLNCYESDPKIGFVCPTSSNVSNLQQVNIDFSDFDQMQEKAALINKPDPKKWEERMRVLPTIAIFSREILDIVGVYDPAFVHDFSEDDLCMRLRRAGYKMILCGDTWICHDHVLETREDKMPAKLKQSIDSGRQIFKQKYHELDAWDDVMNIEYTLLSPINNFSSKTDTPQVLCIDPRCGAPVLEIRNKLRKNGMSNISSYAFTTKAKYFADLQAICEDVKCDRIEFIQQHFLNNSFDIIALCEPLNMYTQPAAFVQALFGFLKPGGKLLFKLRNTEDCYAFLRTSGIGNVYDADLPVAVSLSEITNILKLLGGLDINIISEPFPFVIQDAKAIEALFTKVNPGASELQKQILFWKNYIFQVSK